MKKVLLFIYLLPFLFDVPVGFAYNDTPSMPVGWYLLFTPQNIKTGDTVMACIPVNKYSIQAVRRGYIAVIRNGECPYGTKYLVKKVAAIPFDKVILAPYGINVNGLLTPYIVILRSPAPADELISHFPYGKYDVDGYFLISTYNRLSYDSRYFGYVRKVKYKAIYLGKHLI